MMRSAWNGSRAHVLGVVQAVAVEGERPTCFYHAGIIEEGRAPKAENQSCLCLLKRANQSLQPSATLYIDQLDLPIWQQADKSAFPV